MKRREGEGVWEVVPLAERLVVGEKLRLRVNDALTE